MRGYDPAKSQLPEEWARQESELCEPGMLIFCLDPVTALPGLTFGRKESETPEIYRVRDLCILVGHDNGRALTVNITNSAYELRFLEVLMLEKARKAILDGREFLYVAVKPSQKLSDKQAQEIEQLGTLYAQGGSRRSVVVDSASPQEPALALLSALGANITLSGIGKQVLDIGSICHMLFAPEGRQEDRNKTILKSYFTLIPNSQTLSSQVPVEQPQPMLSQNQELLRDRDVQTLDSDLKSGELNQQQPITATNIEQVETCGTELSASEPDFPENQFISEQAYEPQLSVSSSFEPVPGSSLDAPREFIQSIFSSPQNVTEADKIPETAPPPDPSDSYKHLAEALSSLIDNHDEQTASLEVQPTQEIEEETASRPQAIDSAEFGAPLLDERYEYAPGNKAFSLQSPFLAEEQSTVDALHTIPSAFDSAEAASTDTWAPDSNTLNLSEDLSAAATVIEQTSPADETSDDSAVNASSLATEAEEEAVSPASSGQTTSEPIQSVKRSPSPRAVMHEMATLTSKLEQQIGRASKKLAGKVEEAKHKLNNHVDALVEEAAQSEKEHQDAITELSLQLNKKLDDIEEEIRLKCSDTTSNGRQTIKQLLSGNQSRLDADEVTLCESLRNALREFRIATEALARANVSELEELVHERTQEIEKLVDTVCEHLDELKQTYASKFDLRFKRFEERMSDEITALGCSLERSVKSMVEEIDGSLERASEKLKSAKGDFEHTVNHTVKTSELQVSERVRRLLAMGLLPRLRERKEILKEISAQMSQRFSEESLSQVRAQLLGLEASVSNAKQQLGALIEDCLSSIDGVGREQQASLEELFNETSRYAERATSEVQLVLENAEKQISETDMLSKQLAEDSSVDRDRVLSEEHELAKSKIQQSKQQANAELGATIDLKCSQLQHLSEVSQTDLSNRRLEETQTLRQASETGLSTAREAIQEAFSAIVAAREKYME